MKVSKRLEEVWEWKGAAVCENPGLTVRERVKQIRESVGQIEDEAGLHLRHISVPTSGMSTSRK